MSRSNPSPAREDIGYVEPETDDFTINPRTKKMVQTKKQEAQHESDWDHATPAHVFERHMEALRQ